VVVLIIVVIIRSTATQRKHDHRAAASEHCPERISNSLTDIMAHD